MYAGDITLCEGEGCPLRGSCVRYRAERLGRYNSFGVSPYSAARGGCEEFLDLAAQRPTEQRIRERAYHRWLAEGRPEGQADRHWAEAEAELMRLFEEGLRPA